MIYLFSSFFRVKHFFSCRNSFEYAYLMSFLHVRMWQFHIIISYDICSKERGTYRCFVKSLITLIIYKIQLTIDYASGKTDACHYSLSMLNK